MAFLGSGQLDPVVAEHLGDAIFNAIELIRGDFTDRHKRLVECYTAMLVFFVDDPTKQWIPRLFQYASGEARHIFAWELGRYLGSAQDGRVCEWWSRWLKCYWRNRVQGVPSRLEPGEIEHMLAWLPSRGSILRCRSARDLYAGVAFKQQVGASPWFDLQTQPKRFPHSRSPEGCRALLIALGRFESVQLWYQGKELIGRLPRSGLPSDLQLQLKELEMTRGLSD